MNACGKVPNAISARSPLGQAAVLHGPTAGVVKHTAWRILASQLDLGAAGGDAVGGADGGADEGVDAELLDHVVEAQALSLS